MFVYNSGSQPGVRKEFTGGTQKLKSNSKVPDLDRILFRGMRGTQRGTILILGYASTKRLKTPGL